MTFHTIDLDTLSTVTGGVKRADPKPPGPIKKCLLSAAVAGSIAIGSPAGQLHDDPASQSLHPPASSTTTSQCK
jgi:hypothetical protein